MFGSFSKKIKEAVNKLSGRIEEEAKPDESESAVPADHEEVVEDVAIQEEKREEERDNLEDSEGRNDILLNEVHTEASSERSGVWIQEGAQGKRDEGEGRREEETGEESKPKSEERDHREEERDRRGREERVIESRASAVIPAVKEVPEKRDEEKSVKKEGFFSKFTKPLMEKRLSDEFLDEVLWELEIALLENNVAEEVSQKIVSDLRQELLDRSVRKSKAEDVIKQTMKKTITDILDVPHRDVFDIIESCKAENRSCLIAFVGFNGSGKTTTVAKMGKYFSDKGYSCVMAAADSFRAAAIEQLEHHGSVLGIKVISQKYGTDPAAIIFDAKKHADSRGINVVLADTAGRVHTDRNLIDEMKKIVRVNKPDLKFLVIESIAGNDVVEQAKVFDEIGLDGVILTKADVDDKGGAALSICYTLKKPIYFVGRGQEYSDIEKFDPKKWVTSIFD